MNSFLSMLLQWGLAMTLMLLPVSFFKVLTIGSVDLKPFHLAYFFTVGLGLLSPRVWVGIGRILTRFRLFHLGYLAFLTLFLITIPTLSKTPDVTIDWVRMLLEYVCFLGLAGIIEALPEVRLQRAIRYGAAAGVVFFCGYAYWVFHNIGVNVVKEYYRCIVAGDTVRLQFYFFPTLFQHASGTVADEALRTSFRNSLVGAFILFILLLGYLGSRQKLQGARQMLQRGFVLGSQATCAFLVLASVSRSNILVLIFSLITVWAIQVFARVNAQRVVLTTVGLVIVGSLAFWLSSRSGVGKIVEERVSRFAEDRRISQFDAAFSAIDAHLLTGQGFGTKIPGTDKRVHNLLLAAWYEGGILTFLSAVVFYGALVIVWLIFCERLGRLPSTVSAPWRYAAALPLLPLFRAMVGGDGGNWTATEWVTLAFFLALYIRYFRWRQQELQRSRNEEIGVSIRMTENAI